MKHISGTAVKAHLPYFEQAGHIATEATCHQAKCGTVIVRDGAVIGEGYNGPPLDLETRRTCGSPRNLAVKPKYDKTCCIHAEWRAILHACKTHPEAIHGSTLYFMRIDDAGAFTDAGLPYCTVCSRLALESGVGFFALWNNAGVDLYTVEYDRASYAFSDNATGLVAK